MQRVFLHVDFDSFFASVEQQYNPLFRNKPLGVTATNGRTCIIASSREAKRYGIKTGTRTYEAQKLYPSLILTRANFVEYLKISKKFLAICQYYTPYVELFSIDEVFMDVSKTAHLFGGVYQLIDSLKKRLRDELGEYITVSVGVAHNKLLAKLASGLKKPNGLFEIRPQDVDAVYSKVELTDICGIGERIKLRLNKIGIYTLLELRNATFTLLLKEFGKVEAFFLRSIGLGIDDSPIISYTISPMVKSVGRNYCLPKNEYDQRVILQNVYELCEEIGIKLRRLSKKARTVGLSLRGNRVEHGRKTGDFIDRGDQIYGLCKALYKEWQWANYPNPKEQMVRMISVWATNLEDKENLPLSLFAKDRKKDRLVRTIDILNERFGDHTIRNGFLLYAQKLTTVPNGYLADKYERIKLAKESEEFNLGYI